LIVTGYRFLRDVPTDSWLGYCVHEAACFGQRGVDLFFVLSGFLITGVLLDGRGGRHYFRNFMMRRTLRIFPLYFASLALFLYVIPALWGMHPYEAAVREQAFLWSYLANMRIAALNAWCFGSLDHFWSLAVEEHFYLLWPGAIFLFGLRRSAVVALGAAAICAGGRVLFALLSENGAATDVASFFRFDGLLLGGAAAVLARHEGILPKLRRPAWWLAAAMLPLCLASGVAGARLLTVTHSAWAILWTACLILLVTSQRSSRLAAGCRWEPLRQFGKYSYAMYIFQSPLIPLVAGLWSAAAIADHLGFTGSGVVLAHVIYAVGMLLLTVAAAWLSWHALERHCLRLKRFFPNREAARCPKPALAVPAE
jgi:peptidoglycan/LPS O-acetylase OafA/YrhL